MKIKINLMSRIRRSLAAFSLVEATVGMAIIGATIGALFTGFTSGFFTMQLARENLRATQIMLEKMETIRLYSWKQVTNSAYIPNTFTNFYDPQSTINRGTKYTGTMTITPPTAADIGSSYRDDMRKVVVKVDWTTGHLKRSRQFTSYVSRYGLQDYIY